MSGVKRVLNVFQVALKSCFHTTKVRKSIFFIKSNSTARHTGLLEITYGLSVKF